MKGKKKFLLISGCLILFSLIEIPTGFFKAKIFLLLAPENSLRLNYTGYPHDFSTFCTDGSSMLLLDIALFDSNQNPVPFSRIHVSLEGFSGKIQPRLPITGKDGRAVIRILPDTIPYPSEEYSSEQPRETPVSITLGAEKSGDAQWNMNIAAPPVLLIHGFQDTSESMVPLKKYLEEKGFRVYTMDYSTETNMAAMSQELGKALDTLKSDLTARGIYTGKADIVCHSLGGIVTRYYTSAHSFVQKQDVRKIIFINVPHHGTPWAEAGAELLNSTFLKELYPTAALYTSILPNSINKGLNHHIQVANIALENDEVVPLPSSSLTSWNIGTKIYRIGSEILDIDAIISNTGHNGVLHRQILFYTPVFEEILQDLTIVLPYPQERR